ncbi:hypothetical protein T07_1444 [Trichinella nelsoni]|uniref:Uncharacterized protein n=1 Tax=Trichinella nelsoni TaxID=6336 RepID=A0A0V0SBK7_9BILA|nr:hypothetical protein T07_1444 [Trichinella nelsoni]
MIAWCIKGSIDLFVVFQFRQSGGHSFEHVVANGLVLLVWQKIDAFPRLEASLNNELSKPPPPQPSHPVARFCRANFTWPFLFASFRWCH